MKRKLMVALLCLTMTLGLAGCQSASRDNQPAESVALLTAHAETAEASGAAIEEVTTQTAGGETAERSEQQDKRVAAQSGTAVSEEDVVENSVPVPRANPNSKVAQRLNKEFHEHTAEAQNWLYDYLFGAIVDDSEGEALVDGESATVPEAAQPSEAELVAAVKEYLSTSDYLAKEGKSNQVIMNSVTIGTKTSKEIFDELSNPPKSFQDKNWLEIYNTMSPAAQEEVRQYLSTTQTQETPAKKKKRAQLNLAGKGHNWIIEVISNKNDNAGVRLWRELSPNAQERLISSVDGNTVYPGSDTSLSGTKSEPAPAPNPVSPLLIVFIAVSAVLLIALILVLILFLRRMNEMQERISQERGAKRKLEQELEQSRESQRRPEHRAAPAGTMSPSMKTQFQNSPTRVSTPRRAQQYQSQTNRAPASSVRQPEEGPKPVKVGIGAAAAAAASQRDGGTAPAASFSAAQKTQTTAANNHNVIDGYFAVTDKCREDARYNLDVRLVIEKRSSQPVDPPLPYIVYGDRSVTLNMDFYNRVGGSRPSNERAWDSMMNAATQIERCFNIRSVTTGPITTPAAAAGRKMIEIRRAQINEDGTVAAKGEIVLE